MLREVADGVAIHVSEFCESNAVVVQGRDGVLLIDPGIHGPEIECLANDLVEAGRTVVAGFSTHPHWDHMLWHSAFGAPPRYSTERCAATARDRLAGGIDARRIGIPEDVPLELLGLITGLPAEAPLIPWDGSAVRVLEHQAHAPGHGALLVEESGVLVAGDMLSEVFIPMLDLRDASDPIADYLAALDLFEGIAGEVELVIPGHGSVGGRDELRVRIAADREYVQALRDGEASADPRIGPAAKAGWEWVAEMHTRQVDALALRN